MKRIALPLILLLITALKAYAQDPFEAWSAKTGGADSWRDNRAKVLEMFQEHLFTGLPPKEQAIADQISFFDEPKIELGMLPQASVKFGKRVVSFSTAFLLEVRSFVIATHIETRFGRDGLAIRYARQCSEAAKNHRDGTEYSWVDPLAMAALSKDESRIFSHTTSRQ